MLENRHAKAPLGQVADREGGEGTIAAEVGTEQHPRGIEAGLSQRVLEERRRQVDDGNRLADEGKRGGYRLERRGVAGESEVAGLPARGRAQLRQMSGEPLLQLAGGGGGDQGRPRHPTADVDQEAGPICI